MSGKKSFQGPERREERGFPVLPAFVTRAAAGRLDEVVARSS
ncbi:hypothetical protein [Streptosporangium pseudovulgare]|nr:hypothetical protein [Streptosporangium pseudovulgare]